MMRAPTLLSAVMVGLLVLLAPVARADEPDVSAAITRTLEALETSKDQSLAEVVEELEALGADALPALVDAYWRAMGRQSSRDKVNSPASTPQAVLHSVIADHRQFDLRRAVKARLEARDDTSARMSALRTLASFGNCDSLPLALEIGTNLDPGAVTSRAVLSAWTSALERLMTEQWRAGPLKEAWSTLAGPLRIATCRVLVARGTRTDLSVAVNLIKSSESDLPALLRTLQRASPVTACQLRLPAVLQKLHTHEDPAVRAVVATSLGRLRDPDVIEALIELVADESASVKRAAHASLRALTGARVKAEAEAWEDWLATENAWQEDGEIADRLQSEKLLDASRTLRDLMQRRLVGLRLRDSITELLNHENGGIRLLACVTMRRLGHGAFAAGLVSALEDDEAPVREAAWHTLKVLSGTDLPLDVNVWKTARRHWKQ